MESESLRLEGRFFTTGKILPTREVPFSGFLTYSKNTHLMFIFSLRWGAVFPHLFTSGASQGAWALLQGKPPRGRICSPSSRSCWATLEVLSHILSLWALHLFSFNKWKEMKLKQRPVIHPSKLLSIYPTFHPPIQLSIHPSIHLSIHQLIHPSIHPLIHPSICWSIHSFTHPSFYPSIWPLIHPPTQPSTHSSIHLTNLWMSARMYQAPFYNLSVWRCWDE